MRSDASFLQNYPFEILGDAHLGRVFRIGVPRSRLGEREESQWQGFEKSLATDKGLHVNMGDLFDRIDVPHWVVLRAGQMYKAAARRRPDTTFVVIRGNHDAERDRDVVSAFEVFREIVADIPNIVCLKDEAVARDKHLFIPWNPFKEAKDVVPTRGSYDAAFGHWDCAAPGSNHIPLAQLKDITSVILTGHEHKPRSVIENGLSLTLTGSMQPYAHGEEATPDKYRTFTLDELKAFESKTHDLCIRLKLSPGEEVPELDCLQLQTVTDVPDEAGYDVGEVKTEDFDLQNLFNEVFDEHGVSQPTKDHIWSEFRAEGA